MSRDDRPHSLHCRPSALEMCFGHFSLGIDALVGYTLTAFRWGLYVRSLRGKVRSVFFDPLVELRQWPRTEEMKRLQFQLRQHAAGTQILCSLKQFKTHPFLFFHFGTHSIPSICRGYLVMM